MSITPVMTSSAGATTPAGVATGHASTHLPHRVQASSISSMRPLKASSKKLPMDGTAPQVNL